jgi:cytochrome oxidase Cu insertion factor (SCO1/SenC/PrrC family)
MRKAGTYIVLFIVLILPLVIYVVLKTQFTHVMQPLRIISEKIANPGGSPDSVYKNVGDFAFPSQTGDTVTLDSFRNSIWVANVFSTECAGSCPEVSQGVRDIQRYYRKFPDIRFLSISIDPEADSLPALQKYAKNYEVTENKWWLITGDRSKIQRFAREEFGFGGPIDDTTAAFKPEYTLRLVDREGHFRGNIYNGANKTDVDSVISHIRLLQREYEQK